MNKVKISIWDREFDLEVVYDCYEDEDILDTQREALKKLKEDSSIIDSSLEPLKRYCYDDEHYGGEDLSENIFRAVMPEFIYVKRSEKDRIAGIVCNYKYDMEHGLIIVFKNEKFSEIGEQGII